MDDHKLIPADKVLTRGNVAIFALLLSLFFQAGYLWWISPHLLGFMAFRNIVTSAGIIIVLFAFFQSFFYSLWQSFFAAVEEGKQFFEIKWFTRVRTIANVLFFIAVFFLISFQIIGTFKDSEALQFVWVFLWFMFAASSISGLTHISWDISVIRKHIDDHNVIVRNDLIWNSSYALVTSFSLGVVFGGANFGTECVFISGDTIQTSRLLTVLDKVYVVRDNEQIITISKSSIDQIACPALTKTNADLPPPPKAP